MNKEFVPYELAVKLKELGFDEPCFACYFRNNENAVEYNPDGIPFNHNNSKTRISAPTFSQAFRWFREKYGLLSYVDKCLTDTFRYNIDWDDSIIGLSGHLTYEEAELACLRKLIQIVNSHKLPDLTWKDASEEELKSKELKSMKGKSL